MKAIRVLHIVGMMQRGGQETLLMNIYREIVKENIQFDFAVQTKEKCAYDDEIRALGGNIYHLPAIYVNPFLRFKKLKEIIIDNQYYIVHRHSDKAIEWVDIAASKLGGANVRIYHAHNTKSRFKLLHYLCRPINNYLVTHKLACSEQAGIWVYGKYCYNKGKINIIKNAINIDKFKFKDDVRERVRNELKIQNKFVIGHVGRFNVVKNHRFLVEIFSCISKYNLNAVLLLVGDGKLKVQLAQQINNKCLHNSVLFLGIRDDVHELYQAMDVFVLPSLFEGFPMVAVEAQTAGLPCIMSDNITPEVMLCDNSSRIDLNSDAKIWVNAILNSKRSVDAHKQVYQAGYDIKKMTQKLNEIYKACYENNLQQ